MRKTSAISSTKRGGYAQDISNSCPAAERHRTSEGKSTTFPSGDENHANFTHQRYDGDRFLSWYFHIALQETQDKRALMDQKMKERVESRQV